jgi:hypothetical protein
VLRTGILSFLQEPVPNSFPVARSCRKGGETEAKRRPKIPPVRDGFRPRLFSLKGAVAMTTVTLTSPMNPDILNDTGSGIAALPRPVDTDAAPDCLELGIASYRGDPPPGL